MFETTVELQSNIRLAQSKMRQKSNLIDSNVGFHMQIILELYSAHVKCDGSAEAHDLCTVYSGSELRFV